MTDYTKPISASNPPESKGTRITEQHAPVMGDDVLVKEEVPDEKKPVTRKKTTKETNE